MISTDFLLFEDVSGIDEAMDQFKRYNPSLDIEQWDFAQVGRSFGGDTVRAIPKNKRSFYLLSPVHFWKWSSSES